MATNGADTHQAPFSVEDCNAALSESVRWIRQYRKLTPADVAQKMGVTEGEWERIESGELPLTFGMARNAARALNFTFVQFTAYVEAVLTGKSRVGVEINIPHTASNEDRLRAFTDAYAALEDPDNRGALEVVIDSFVKKKAAQS